MLMYLAFVIPPLILGLWAQRNVMGTFRRHTEVRSIGGRTGAQVARAILDQNGLHDVRVEAVPGEMTDHYDPRSRTVRLSEPVYGYPSISAVSVAAHEVGHAIQHAKKYAPMQVRALIFPVASFSSQAWMFLLIGGFLLNMLNLIWLAVALYSFAVLFHFVTLPVEFDASRRAKAQLLQMGLVGNDEVKGTTKVLNAAAMTYVAAALAALSTLLYYVFMLLGNRD